MDVARTLYTSAVKKLFDQGGWGSTAPVAPIVPTPMSGIHLIACQSYYYGTAGVSLLYIDTNCCQHVMAAMLAIYLEPLTFSCTLQSQLICSVVIDLCILTVIDCYVLVHEDHMHARAVLAMYMQYITEYGHGHCPHAPAAAVYVIKKGWM